MNNRFYSLTASLLACLSLTAQTKDNDTLTAKPGYLKEITIVGQHSRSDIHQLPEIVGTSIFAGKKNGLVVMDNVNGNIVTNNMRQVMAKVPGVHVWESDGSGIQIGIAARGLSPNRSWEFNIRQNGYDIAADPFGYPEAYYTPQLQAVQRIQIVRGSGSLQYGPQFGGMVNFVLRDGSDISKPFQFETQNTAGSYGLVNTYNAVGGKTDKLNYYAFYDHRNADGWRDNSQYKVNTGFATASYQLTSKLKAGLELMQWNMRSQQPGGLTDANFAENAQQSFRSRNWFDIKWNTMAATLKYDFNPTNRLDLKVFGVIADRNSIGYLNQITIKDTINASTLQYNNRTVDRDKYRNVGAELRYLGDYSLGSSTSTISTGVRYYNGNTYRYKNGKGDNGAEYNTNVIGAYPQDLDFNTSNAAAFAENIFRLGKKLIVIPGIRLEHIGNKTSGQLSLANDIPVPAAKESRKRNFVLAGVGAEYHIGETEIYGNWSQAYRPALFSDLTANPTTDVIDQNLRDAKGYNIDLGWRGKVKDWLFFDVSLFMLQYNNRIGLIAQQKNDGSFYNLRTNVGNSISQGVESIIEFNPVKAFSNNLKNGSFGVFVSAGYTNAEYADFRVITKSGSSLVETNLKNKKVENAPEWIVRYGANYYFKGLTLTAQWSYVGKAFSDANNTVTPSANGQNGLIPSYHIGDISASWKFLNNYNIKAGINNVTNERYFTRRAGGYPGPGLMPSDARGFYISVGAKF